MGRKSLNKERLKDPNKTDQWLIRLLPLLQDQDLSNLNMNKLSELMGKSKSTIYQYFRTKDDIIERLVEIKLSEVQESITIDKRIEDILETYEHFVLKVCQGLDGISIHFMNQLKQEFPLIWNNVEGFMNQVLSFFEALYQRGIAEGIFKAYPISMLLALDEFFMYQFMIDPKRSSGPVEALVSHYMNLRMEGLRSKSLIHSGQV